jgi:PHD/YefM family antitoxin component YafN of YafNO toxin-antitoxin module
MKREVLSMQRIKKVINKNDEMIIGKNNKDNVLVMSMEEYKNNIFDNETVKKLLKSEDDIKNGRTRKATEVIKDLRAKYGF